MVEGRWSIADCDASKARELARELEVSETTARVLVRRGLCEPEAARAFLEGGDPRHDPFLLGDMEAACAAIRGAIAAGKRICVHGDYDVDGICATTLALLILRELGAEVESHLPSRFEEGYGVASQTLSRLAEEGCGLVLTVDCGITAVAEIAEARAAGLEVVVTDHHRPGEELPDCPVVATRPSDYPFPELCGTGVVYKLGQALLGPDSEVLSRHLDLVALATIADVVPLVDENRALAIAGLRVLARTQKPGLRALMESARVDAGDIDEGAVGFRLGPRINAAGRLCRPVEALELLLTDDPATARELAERLETLNRDRQALEQRIVREAIAQVEEWPEARRRRRGYVIADEGWHEGVIGIVASRLAERYNRPVVLLAAADGEWKGSGRSIPAFDLHGGLSACSHLLERWGGHRAAAGLSVAADRLDAFVEAFAEHADAQLEDQDLEPVTAVDAIVSPKELTLDLAGELERLAPFGLGNPGVMLLLAGCQISEASAVGEGRHLRFRVRDPERNRDAGSAIAFGMGAHLDRLRRLGAYDVAFRLQENRWNGTVAPQLVVRRVFDTDQRYHDLRRRLAGEFRDPAGWSDDARAVFSELGLDGASPSWRSLLESATFRALLEAQHEEVMAKAA